MLLPGAEAKEVLPLGDVVRGVRHRGSVATGGISQDESYKRIITGERRGRKQRECCYWGEDYKGSAATKTKVTAKYCHRGNIINESHRVLPSRENLNRKLISFVRNKCHYTKFITFSKKKR